MPRATGSGISQRIRAALAVLTTGGCLLVGCATLPDDGPGATLTRFDNLRDSRYCELLLIGGDAIARDLHVAVFNTLDLNDRTDPSDTCPAALWERVDAVAVQRHYEVLGVHKDGPRHWTLDWLELPVGIERDFDGLRARWIGELHPPKGANGHETDWGPYRPMAVARRSAMGFAKGQPVFFLEDPHGAPWVMVSYATSHDTALSYRDLQGLGGRLKPPPGWRYGVKVLDKHLSVHAVEGHDQTLRDDLANTYVACRETACSFTP